MNEVVKHRIQTYSESKKTFLHSIFKKITINARNEFFRIFKENTKYSISKSIIDIGTTPSLDAEQNILLDRTKKNQNITCLSNQNCKILSKKYPNIKRFITIDGKSTKLPNNSFDIVHSNATIEHVGSRANQVLFIKECLRISKKKVFIQTPNRFYPLDFHTTLPLIHWLPKNIHRKILKIIGLNFYASEKNLNLLSENDIISMCKELDIKNFKIVKYNLLFLPSNLIFIITK